VAYACLEVCLSSFDKILGSPLQGELASFVKFGASFDLSWFEGELVIRFGFRGSMAFCIEKHRGLVTALLSWKLVLPSIWLDLRGSWCFVLYIVYFAFLLHFLHTHLSHFASHVILACICLIMLITVLG
jgi:hypothetical protein